MSESVVNTLINGLFSLVALIAGYFFRILLVWYKGKDSRKFAHVIGRVKDVYGHIGILRRETKALRVLVVKAHNGGGKPKLSGPLYASVLYGDWEQNMTDASEWVNQRLDEGYVTTLNDMLAAGEGWVDMRTENLKDGQLKDMLAADNVEHAMFFCLAQLHDSLLYLSINFGNANVMQARQRSIIREIVNNMRALFKAEPVS